MARGNLILGTAKGKLGDTVLYRSNGQQQSRVRVRQIKNPKSEAQAVNRALLSTLSTAYAYMKGITDHSFQGLSTANENMRKFMKLNQGIARATGSVAVDGTDTGYNFNFKGESALRPNPYAISRGTLPAPDLVDLSLIGATSTIDGFGFNQTISAMFDATTTYTQFCAALNVEVGTQLTFCIISDDTFTGSPSETNIPKSYGNFHYARVILCADDGNGDVPMFATTEQGSMSINPNYANSRNQGSLFFHRIGDSTLRIVVANQEYPLAMGIIVSNYSSRTWLRSNTDMLVVDAYKDSNTMSEVYASYMYANETTPSSTEYLNQGEGTRTATDEGGSGTESDAYGYLYGMSGAAEVLLRTYEGSWQEQGVDSRKAYVVSEYPLKNYSDVNEAVTGLIGLLARTPSQALTFFSAYYSYSDPEVEPVLVMISSMKYPCYCYYWDFGQTSQQFNAIFGNDEVSKNVLVSYEP